MSTSDGQQASAAVLNAAYVSKTADSTVVSKIELARIASGVTITDVQSTINDHETRVTQNESDISTNQTNISSNDTDIATNVTNIATNVTDIGTNATDIGTNATNIGTNTTDIGTNTTALTDKVSLTIAENIGGIKTFDDNVIMSGDLTVNGTTTTLNTATLDVTDTNITVNNTGNKLSADGIAGLTVEMSDETDAALIYDSTLSSKFKIGNVASEIEIADISSAQDISNKAIIDPSRLDVKKDTKANLNIYASTAANGQLCFATDEKLMYQVVDSLLTEVGGGGGGAGGGLDIFHLQELEDIDPTDYIETGNNATFSGGGSLNGALSSITSGQIAGTQSHKYIAGAASQNDYWEIESITLEEKQKGHQCKMIVWADMTNMTTDVEIVIWDVTNTSKLNLDVDVLKANEGLVKYEVIFDIPSTATTLTYGFHLVDAPVAAETFTFDDLEFTNDVFSKANVVSQQSDDYYTVTGFGSTDNKIPEFDNIRKSQGSGLYTIINNGTNGFSVTATKKIQVVATLSAYNSTAYSVGLSLNSNQLTTTLLSITEADRVAGTTIAGEMASTSVTLNLSPGDVLRPHTSGAASSGGRWSIQVTATAIAENVISAVTQSGADSMVRLSTSNGFGSTANKIRRFLITEQFIGASIEYTDSATTGSLLTIKESGQYNISYSDNFSAAASPLGISLNSSSLSTSIESIPTSERLAIQAVHAATDPAACSWSGYLNMGDEIRAHTGGSTGGASARVSFSISKQAVTNHMVALPTSKQNSYSAKITNNGTAAILSQNADWIESVNRTGLGTVVVTFKPGIFTVQPSLDSAGITNNNVAYVINESLTSVTIQGEVISSGGNIDTNFSLNAEKQGVDHTPPGVYVGKVARERVAYIEDRKSIGTDGGASVASIVHTRDLNTVTGDVSIISLSANQMTLNSGEYQIDAIGVTREVNKNRLFLYNVTDATYDIEGVNTSSVAGDSSGRDSELSGRITLKSTKVFELRHWTQSSFAVGFGSNSNGTGNPGSYELFARVIIRKIL